MRKGRTDYRMQRRAVVRDVRSGLRDVQDVTDAHPDLVRAGSHIGVTTRHDCPLCGEDELREVTYAFKDRTSKPQRGRAMRPGSLRAHADRYGDQWIYTVEVCLACHWHHLLESYLLLARDSATG